MQISRELLDRLSYNDLQLYAGRGVSRDGLTTIFHSRLMFTPVNVKVLAPRTECDDALYEIAQEAERAGTFKYFDDMKAFVNTKLAGIPSAPPRFRLSVLPNGITVGEPEDLLAYIEGRTTNIMYEEKGLGNKLAEVIFKDVVID